MERTKVLIPVSNLSQVDKGASFSIGMFINKMYHEPDPLHVLMMEKELMEKVEPYAFLVEK